jgi:carboxymethylenebutenolidase
MPNFWESTTVNGKDMGLYVSVPEGDGPFPAVIVIQHQGGVDDFIQEMTRRMPEAGYVGVAPVLYHRDPVDSVDDAPTRRGRLLDANLIADVQATMDFLSAHPGIDSSRVGIVGYCMGGRVAYLMAAAIPGMKAAVDYYGGNRMLSWGDGPTPFDRTADIQCPVLGHFGEIDANPSQADMAKFDAEMTRLGKEHQFYSYPNADHGFMNERGPRYNADADKNSWPRTLDFFARTLQQAPVAADN